MPPERHAESYSGRTAWARNLAAPVRTFLSTEETGAGAMLAATIAALLWANVSSSYDSVWHTRLAITLGGGSIATDLRGWVNEGLMTLFFLVVGLEAKRELDLGELRERRRLAIPVVAALGGMAVPALIYTAANAGGAGAHGWGAAMSTDTAFTLGAVALFTPRAATRLRVFLLTLAVVDDLTSLFVIGVVYTKSVSFTALAVAIGLFALLIGLRFVRPGRTPASVALGLGMWAAMFKSGVDPVISGLAIGLATSAYPPPRERLEEATALARSFREQPTPELARSAQQGVLAAVSVNERLQYDLHPWTSYVIVPLFALANAGVHLSGKLLGDAAGSPITLGIALGYLLGKPVGIAASAWIASRPELKGPRSPLSGPALVTAGSFAGIGFTVSVLISTIAFRGEALNEAKLGALASLLLAPLVGFAVTRVNRRLPRAWMARQLGRTSTDILDLAVDVDPDRDHIRGPDDAPVTLVEYGDFECQYCGQAEAVIRELLAEFGDEVRYVWRHLPLNDVHPFAQTAAEAAEAAAVQGRFWDMYDELLGHPGALTPTEIAERARMLGLDAERLLDEVRRRVHAPRVSLDVVSADESGVAGTPTFFVNGRRHYGAYDVETLSEAVRAARRRAAVEAKLAAV
jgi:Na+/H+ antiporter NhaA